MTNVAKEARQWLKMAHDARRSAAEKQDEYSEPAMQVADLCEHIAAAMQRIEQIIISTHKCACGKCPEPEYFKPH